MKTYLTVFSFTMMNIRYSALILPTGVVAYLLHMYVLALLAGILLIAAFAAEVALSIANGVETHQQIKMHKQLRAEDEKLLASMLAAAETHANDWTHQHGSEGEAGTPEEGRPPEGEGEAPAPSR